MMLRLWKHGETVGKCVDEPHLFQKGEAWVWCIDSEQSFWGEASDNKWRSCATFTWMSN